MWPAGRQLDTPDLQYHSSKQTPELIKLTCVGSIDVQQMTTSAQTTYFINFFKFLLTTCDSTTTAWKADRIT